MRLEWSQPALNDLDEIRRYIVKRNPAAAERVKMRITSAMELLARRPYIGRIGRVLGTREYVFTDIPYIAVHQIDEEREEVTILNIVHTARLYPPSETDG